MNLWRPSFGGRDMGTAISLRDDFDGTALRQLARNSKSANQARRLLALAEIYDGGSRTSAARIGGVGLQIVRDWVVRFNARGPEGLLDGKAPGRQSLLNDAQRRALVETVECGSGRRTRSRGAGPDAGRGPRHQKTNGRNRLISLARSARSTARARGWCCPSAIPKP